MASEFVFNGFSVLQMCVSQHPRVFYVTGFWLFFYYLFACFSILLFKIVLLFRCLFVFNKRDGGVEKRGGGGVRMGFRWAEK